MKALDDYGKAQQEIYAYFDYEEEWRIFPFQDSRDAYWLLWDNQVWFSWSPNIRHIIDTDEDADSIYSNIVCFRNGQPAVYRGEAYTMILVDTQTDGNFFLQIFKNDRERPSRTAA